MNLEQIKPYFLTYQNGVTVELMEKAGIQYKTNYGVALLELRKFAKEQGVKHQLALDLWHSKIREAMIIATLIVDVDQVSADNMDEWAGSIINSEIAEQIAANLLWRTECCFDIVDSWLQDENAHKQQAALMTLVKLLRMKKDFNGIAADKYVELVVRMTETDSYYVKNAVVLTLQAFLDTLPGVKIKLLEIVGGLSEDVKCVLFARLWLDD